MQFLWSLLFMYYLIINISRILHGTWKSSIFFRSLNLLGTLLTTLTFTCKSWWYRDAQFMNKETMSGIGVCTFCDCMQLYWIKPNIYIQYVVPNYSRTNSVYSVCVLWVTRCIWGDPLPLFCLFPIMPCAQNGLLCSFRDSQCYSTAA